MKRNIIAGLLIVFFSSVSVYGQLGVNTSTPNASAALDIHSPDPSDQRGVLLPRMTTTERNNIASPALGLMVFDTTDNLFYYYDGTKWIGLVPKQPATGYGTDPSIRGTIVVDSGSVIAPNIGGVNSLFINSTTTNMNISGQLNISGYSVNPFVPTGGIIMWSGSPAAIPVGWALCDGNAGRPDLKGRFIVGYDPSGSATPTTAPNDGTTQNYGTIANTGGEVGHLLTSGESGLPVHTHTIAPHSHPIQTGQNVYEPGGYVPRGDGSYVHNSPQATDAVSLVTDNNTAVNAVQPHENRPPYYVLAYIIKL